MYLLNIPKNLEQREQDFIPRADKLSDMFCLIKHGQINDFLPLVDNADCQCCQRKPLHCCIIIASLCLCHIIAEHQYQRIYHITPDNDNDS